MWQDWDGANWVNDWQLIYEYDEPISKDNLVFVINSVCKYYNQGGISRMIKTLSFLNLIIPHGELIGQYKIGELGHNLVLEYVNLNIKKEISL